MAKNNVENGDKIDGEKGKNVSPLWPSSIMAR